MVKCEKCQKNVIEYYIGLNMREPPYCLDCYRKGPRTNNMHKVVSLCRFKGCLEIPDFGMDLLCAKHCTDVIYKSCGRCEFHTATFYDLCPTCRIFLAQMELFEYRKLGSADRFRDYCELGSYEELADLVSRRDIYEHCDEMNI